jgi:transcriptional regulator with XRE-family HTH domain
MERKAVKLLIKITLRAARVNLGYTLKQAAKQFEIHHETLAKYEQNSSNIPRSFYIKIESVYGIPVEFIYFGKQDEFQKSQVVVNQ